MGGTFWGPSDQHMGYCRPWRRRPRARLLTQDDAEKLYDATVRLIREKSKLLNHKKAAAVM